MRLLTGVFIALLFSPVAHAITVAPEAATGDTVISLNPSTPAPGERFTITVRGTWHDGCVPKYQSVTAGNSTTLQVNAVADPCNIGCIQTPLPYALTTPQVTINFPGVYTIEYYVTQCNRPRTLVASQTVTLSGSCQFDRSLT